VLSTPRLRAIYDQFGSEGLKDGAPQGHDTHTEPWVFGGDADGVFKEFFGTDNPFQDIFPPLDELKFGDAPEITQKLRRKQDPPIEHDLFITLEEAFLGSVKKLKISRKILSEDGHTTRTREKILTVNVKKGWKEGTKVTFLKEGDQGPNNIPADVVFTLKYRPHARFERQGLNLVHVADISLVDALCGCVVSLLTLDDRKLSIPVNDVITPTYTKRVEGEGMPSTKDPSKRGDLILKFNIEFPRNLTDQSKAFVRKALQ
jgi:DnaJ family protein B protein 13